MPLTQPSTCERRSDRGFFDTAGGAVRSVGRFFKRVLDVPKFLDAAGGFARGWVMYNLLTAQWFLGGTQGRAQLEDLLQGQVSLRPLRQDGLGLPEVLLGPTDPDLRETYSGPDYVGGFDFIACNEVLSNEDLVTASSDGAPGARSPDGLQRSYSQYWVPDAAYGDVSIAELFVTVAVYQVRPSREAAVDERIGRGMPASCTESAGRFYGTLTNTVVDLRTGADSLLMMTFTVTDPDLGVLPRENVSVFARSGDWLLLMAVNADIGRGAVAAKRLYARQSVALDDLLDRTSPRSSDADFRVALMDLVVREFGDWQLLVTVHDRLWRTQLRDVFQRAGHPIAEVDISSWDFDRGPALSGATDADPAASLWAALEPEDPHTRVRRRWTRA